MKRFASIAIVLALLALAPRLLPEFTITLANYIGLYAMVTLGLVLLTGVAGLTSFGQAAFVGLGAYATAVLTTATDLPAWLSWLGASAWLTLLAGLLLTTLVAAALGSLTLRLSGHYLPLSTIAKVYTAEAVYRATKDAAECFGAMGVMRDMPLQQYVHDALVCLHSGAGNTDAKLRIAEALARYRRPASAAVLAAE